MWHFFHTSQHNPPPEPHPTDETPRPAPAKESTDVELNLATFLYGPEEEVA